MSMAQMADDIHRTAVEKGWWDPDKARTLGDQLMLMVSELAEALEEYRNGHDPAEIYIVDGKPEGVPVELADCIIRILDTSENYGIDMEAVVLQKMAYNDTRAYRHGNKAL